MVDESRDMRKMLVTTYPMLRKALTSYGARFNSTAAGSSGPMHLDVVVCKFNNLS